jgi:hypothetical protein
VAQRTTADSGIPVWPGRLVEKLPKRWAVCSINTRSAAAIP